MDKKEIVYNFLKKNITAVLATATNDGNTNASRIYYYPERELDIYFITRANTQKAKNLKSNPDTSIVIDEDKQPISLQMHGQSEMLNDSDKLNNIRNKILDVATNTIYPWPIIDLMSESDIQFYCFKPDWLRFINLEGINESEKDNIPKDHLFELTF